MFSRISRYPSPSCDCDSFPSSNQILHLSTIQSDLQGIKLDSTFKHDSTFKSCFGLLLCSTFKLCSQSVPVSIGSYFGLSLLWLVTLLWSIFVHASGDAFDQMDGIELLSVANLSLDEPDFEAVLFTDDGYEDDNQPIDLE